MVHREFPAPSKAGMRPRIELALALVVLLGLALAAGFLGASRNQSAPPDSRRSTLLRTPAGARGYAEVLERLGVQVDRWRQRAALLDRLDKPERPLFVELSPTRFYPGDARYLAEFTARGDLLLAGFAASAAMRCFGYAVDAREADSIPLYRVERGEPRDLVAWSRDLVLVRHRDTVVVDSSDVQSGLIETCEVTEPVATDTLLVSAGGRPGAVRLRLENGAAVTLVADGYLFSNRQLQESDAGLVLVPLVAGRYRTVVFDEYVHGFGPSGSLARAVLAWTLASPWGWMGWQLAAAGLIALLAGAVRFGPPRSVIDRRRRSPLEHVRALATALAAARGAHVAVELIVRGLRRRLSAGAQPLRDDVRPWLERLAMNSRTPRARQAAQTLVSLTQGTPGPDAVRRAANAVEDVWQDLTPSMTKR